MKKNFTTLALLLLFLVGCSSNPVAEANADVVVLDIAEIAKATATDKRMNQEIMQLQERLKSQLAQVQDDLKKKLQAERNKIAASPGSQAMKALELKAGQDLQASVQRARQEVQQLRANLLKQFQDEIRPIAEKIAKARNASVVRINDATILWYSDAVNITDEIIAKLKAKK